MTEHSRQVQNGKKIMTEIVKIIENCEIGIIDYVLLMKDEHGDVSVSYALSNRDEEYRHKILEAVAHYIGFNLIRGKKKRKWFGND